MARTPSKPVQALLTPFKTPQSKHRQQLTATKNTQPSPNPIFAAKENIPTEHPVEVIGRIRDYPDRKDKPLSSLLISSDGQTIRVPTDIGYRDFSLDGVSVSEDENLDEFYEKFVQSRINGVKVGAKCTIMMYGPTGSGKSHTMFGCSKQPGIVYKALRDILGEGDDENHMGNRGIFVHVTVLEIYNEEIYDLLSNNNGGGVSLGWPRGNASKVRLEVIGKKAKNATFISGNEAGKISREVAKVEKRRIVKSTLCNDRSSRSHCLIILDVPSVGGRLMLVDMAGSENIEQAGQIGFEAKMQTGKINQGNIALKRVVESIANGDSYVPFRDSKLTMLLQDSFEDDKSKILMILCASPDPKEMHKTICTLEYGAKAKCIIRATHTPIAKDKIISEDVILGSRIAAMDQFIYKLQMENKLKEKERDEAHKELLRKEEEVAELRAKLTLMEGRCQEPSEEEIKSKVDERTRILKLELEKKLAECQKKANEFVELGRRRMEEKILKQKEEVEMLKRRLEEIEFEISCSRNNGDDSASEGFDGSNFMKRLSEIYAEGDQGMEKSMDLDMGDQPIVHDVKEIEGGGVHQPKICMKSVPPNTCWAMEEEDNIMVGKFTEKVCLSTVFEVEEGEEDEEKLEEPEVDKEIIEDKVVDFGMRVDEFHPGSLVASRDLIHTPYSYRRDLEESDYNGDRLEKPIISELGDESNNSKDAASARRTRIQNIFMLCGNHRELSQHVKTPTSVKRRSEDADVRSSPVEHGKEPEFRSQNSFTSDGSVRNITDSPGEKKKMETHLNRRYGSETALESKENCMPGNEETDGQIEVYVKWEASKECPGKFVTKLKVGKNSSLADLRKLIETHLRENNKKQEFTFLMLGDPTGAPVAKEKEVTAHASKLPICHNQISGHLACLRPIKKTIEGPNHLPFSSLENKLPFILDSLSATKQQVEGFSPKIGQQLNSAPLG